MTEKILNILDKKIIILEGMKVEVELRMIENTWGKLSFKPYARFMRLTSPLKELKEKYKNDFNKYKEQDVHAPI